MNSCSFHLFSFAAVIFFFFYLNPIGAATCHPDDEAGLLAFKSGITEDPSGLLSSWKKGTDCCSWDGVSCPNGDRVVQLFVRIENNDAGSFLSGTISPLLAKLQQLKMVLLTDFRNITGSFPQFLFHLPNLESAFIENNGLSGSLPANIGDLSSLQVFSVSGNKFTGSIPNSISNLTRLSYLNLGNNLLTGTIPLGFANLKLMTDLRLDGNRLSGNIPNIFTSMKKLRSLTLSRNGFSGKLPPSMESLRLFLTHLELGQNNLSGMIPSYLSRFNMLITLDLSGNQFSGAVPKSFANFRIANLNLSRNFLTDPFPVLKNVNRSLFTLDLSYNKFHLKTIPEWVTSASNLYSWKLVNCGINMSLDDWNPMQYIFYDSIDLSENDISGSPAKFMKKQIQLREFRAAGNKLRFNMGKLTFSKSLEKLDLSRNLLFGKVPVTVVGLQTLNLSQNHLCGKLPVTNFSASAFTGNDCLCGSPLAPCQS